MRREEHARPVHARVHCDECKFSMNDGRFDREDAHRKQIPHSRFSRSSRTAANNARKRNTPDTSVSVLRVFSLVFCFCFSLLFFFFFLPRESGYALLLLTLLINLLLPLCYIFLSFCRPFKSLSPATLNSNFYMTEHRLMLYLLSWSTLLMLSTLRSLSVSLKPCLLRCCCFISIIVAAAAAAFFFFFFFFFLFV